MGSDAQTLGHKDCTGCDGSDGGLNSTALVMTAETILMAILI